MIKKIEQTRKFIEYIILLLIIVAVWQILEIIGVINPVTLPAPDTIVKKFISLLLNGKLLNHLLISVVRVLKGYLMAAMAGIVLGVIFGLSERLKRMTDLIIQIVKPIPPIAWIPLVILWFGIGEGSKVFLIFLGGFFTILINVIDGIQQTDQKLIEVSNVMETPRLKYVFQLVIPSAMPNIFTGLRVGLSACWMCVVAAELVASSTGLGYMIMNARQFCQTDVVIVGMITIGITGKLMDSLIRFIEKRVVIWNR